MNDGAINQNWDSRKRKRLVGKDKRFSFGHVEFQVPRRLNCENIKLLIIHLVYSTHNHQRNLAKMLKHISLLVKTPNDCNLIQSKIPNPHNSLLG